MSELSCYNEVMKNKGFGMIGVLLVVIIVAVIAGIVWYVGHEQGGQAQQPNQETTTASYQTMTYKNASFSFSYPSSWIIGPIPGFVPAGIADLYFATTSDVAAFESSSASSSSVTVDGTSCNQSFNPVSGPVSEETHFWV
jgi:hypothetical protein